MNTDNMFDVLPGDEDVEEEKDASSKETPPQPTRQGLAGERSPNARALAAARAAAAAKESLYSFHGYMLSCPGWERYCNRHFSMLQLTWYKLGCRQGSYCYCSWVIVLVSQSVVFEAVQQFLPLRSQ